ncbi:MAG: hypothetical protein FWC64_05155 [Treponema sp.]|nr:hypothetical protein [Treponema sp.]
MAVTIGGQLWGWGDNRFGQIGNGSSLIGGTPGNNTGKGVHDALNVSYNTVAFFRFRE